MKGEDIEQIRKDMGISLGALGRILKMRSATLSDYIKGKYPIPEDKARHIKLTLENRRKSEYMKEFFKDIILPPAELSSTALETIELIVRKVCKEVITQAIQNKMKPYDPLDGYRLPSPEEDLDRLRERCKNQYMRG